MPTVDEILAAIRPVKVRHLPAFLTACEPMAACLMAGDVAGAFVQHADNLITAVALGADVDRAWLEDQTADVLIDLAAQVMEVNIDFFVQTLLPKIAEAASRIEAVMPAGGTNGSQA
ncbi:MAG: hypothetical protein EOM10_00175 [Opitutae bacterium]|nr:hypothetical protein [Opitutae bacterium]